jgi:hypothetical protein
MQRISKIRRLVRFFSVAAVLALGVGPAAANGVLTGPAGSVAFGTLVTNLPNGQIVVTDPSFNNNVTGAKYGAVYLYATNLTLLSAITGGNTNDQVGSGGITLLANGNYLIHSPKWSTNCGAVTWVNATNGILADGAVGGVVTATNSLVGSKSGNGGNFPSGGDMIGWYNGIRYVTALSNGNFVVLSRSWNWGGANNWAPGAVTWGDGTKGVTGVVSAANSLVGSGAGIVVLNTADCNYVVPGGGCTIGGISCAGAATWCSGTNAWPIGEASAANSLVGSQDSDGVGYVVTALANGNYVVASSSWKNGDLSYAGAVTWCDGVTGRTGAVSTANSLVGSMDYDRVGYGGVTALPNGNYVVSSAYWGNGTLANVGAVTWCDGTKVMTGEVSAVNSLVGSTADDNVGDGGVYALPNGNYVVSSVYSWPNYEAFGAVTWGDGTKGVTGVVSAVNSLVGSKANDQVGIGGVTALTNGNYVVRSQNWDNDTATSAGAVTWGDGSKGVTGEVAAVNSLVGSTANDQVGIGGVTALTNGNYLVRSRNWDNGAVTDAGAVTWGDGSKGVTGLVSAVNSLVGSKLNDQVGSVYALANGNYVVSSVNWDNGALANAGAVTWGDGSKGVTGAVSAVNSLVGSTASDGVGVVTALANGNYVVRSSGWDNGAGTNVGAVTWCDGVQGVTGVVSAANSLVGSKLDDQVGIGGVTALANGNYVVRSLYWNNGAVSYAGAVTWCDGTQGVTGAVSANNSLVGSTVHDFDGCVIAAQPDGNYVVVSKYWDDAGLVDAGAVTLAPGQRAAKGNISSVNSVLGTVASKGTTLVVVYDASNKWVLVGEPQANQVTLRSVPVAQAVDLPVIENAAVTAVLTNGATCNGMLVSAGGAASAVGLLWGPSDGGQVLSAWAHTNWFNNGLAEPAWTNNTPFSTNLTDVADGIAPNQTYYYTWVAVNAGGAAVAERSKFFITGEVTVEATDPLAQYPGKAGAFTISRPAGCTNASITVPFVLSGSALHGTDYATVPTSVTLAAGATQANVVIAPIYDADTTNEQVVLTLAAGNGVYPYGPPANVATVVISNYVHTPGPATTVQAGYWTNGATWASGEVPGLGDEVTVSHAVTLNGTLPYAFGSVSNSATLTFRGVSTVLRATTVMVAGTITHDAQSQTPVGLPRDNSTYSWTPDNRIWIQCTNLTVLAGGKLDAAGKGYVGGTTTGGSDGNGLWFGRGCGNGGGAYGGEGAAHGGIAGGWYNPYDSPPAPRPSTYGSITNPAAPGSGGGGTASSPGGAGGGWVTIEATDVVTVEDAGVIDASGREGGGAISAGGSGGSILIRCKTFQGAGLVCAAGGRGQALNGEPNSGNGGGGRIAVHVDADAQRAYASGAGTEGPRLVVARGAAAVVSDVWNYLIIVCAGSGTIYVSDPSSLGVEFSGGATFSWASQNPWAPTYLKFDSGDYSLALTGVSVTVAGDVTIQGDARLTLTNRFTLSCANLVLTNTASLYLCPGVTNATTPNYTARVIVNGNMEIHTNCVVVPSASQYATHEPPDGGVVRFEVGSLTIHPGGWLNADAAGYANAFGPGKGRSTVSSGYGAGGGYGGVGGDSTQDVVVLAGGVSYGSAVAPMLPGSGGGNGRDEVGKRGGNGGGCIWIRATGSVINDGTISANGSAGGNASSKGGGGSGGSVFIVCRSITGTGSVAANGANGWLYNGQAGGGGGGRIAIWYDFAVPTDLDAFLARGSTAYVTNAPAGYTLSQLSSAGGWAVDWSAREPSGADGTKSFYRVMPSARTVIILR